MEQNPCFPEAASCSENVFACTQIFSNNKKNPSNMVHPYFTLSLMKLKSFSQPTYPQCTTISNVFAQQFP